MHNSKEKLKENKNWKNTHFKKGTFVNTLVSLLFFNSVSNMFSILTAPSFADIQFHFSYQLKKTLKKQYSQKIIEKNVIIILKFRLCKILTKGSSDGAVVRVLASHQCVLGLILGPSIISGPSLLLVFYSAPRGFFRYLSFALSLKTNSSKYQFDPRRHF